MRTSRRSAAAAAVALLAIVVATSGPAYAAVPIGWEPDPAAIGSITLYDAAGNAVSSGSLSSHPFAAYAVASGAGRTGDDAAQLVMHTPRQGVAASQWSGDVLTALTGYPVLSAPADIAGQSGPVATGTGGDMSLQDYVAEFPNTSTASGYQNLYQLRLYTSGPGQPPDISHYYALDIQVDPAAGTWSVAYPCGCSTIQLRAAPLSPASAPCFDSRVTVTLAGAVSPAGAAGSVRFFDGTTDLGPADTYSPISALATKVLQLAVGSHQLVAVFTPADPQLASSTSEIIGYVVLPQDCAPTTVPVTADDSTPPYAGNLSLAVVPGAVTLTQLDPNTPAGHPAQATDPTGHRHAWVFTGTLAGVSVVDTRPNEPGWALTALAADLTGPTPIGATDLGWIPALTSAGSDAEGIVAAGTPVDSRLRSPGSAGLSSPQILATAPTGAGLGTQNLGATIELRVPDTVPMGTYATTLTLTLISA